jgi:hypothetical protein
MFANALKDCRNSSLESVDSLCCEEYYHDEEVWNREVVPILDFNSERSRFQIDARICFKRDLDGSSADENFINALVRADEMNNHHFRFWLVLNHADKLLRGYSEQACVGQGQCNANPIWKSWIHQYMPLIR